MYFALGFLVCGLLALLFLPAFWRRAVRLSTRRVEMRLPLSMDEIVAERDQLRAEFALERRRVEQKAEDLAEARARDMAELGRRATRILALETSLGESTAESARRGAEIAALEHDLSAARADLGALHQWSADLDARLGRATGDLRDLRAEHEALGSRADEQRAHIAALETRSAAREADLVEIHNALETARREILELSRAANDLLAERDFAREDLAATIARRDALAAEAREARERAEKFEEEHRAERRQRMRAETELATRTSALAFAESREAALRDREAAVLEEARGDAHALRQRIDELKASNESLERALASVRAEAERRAADGDAAPAPSAVEIAILREAIRDVGRNVLRMVETRDDAPPRPRAANQDEGDKPSDLERVMSRLGAAE